MVRKVERLVFITGGAQVIVSVDYLRAVIGVNDKRYPENGSVQSR